MAMHSDAVMTGILVTRFKMGVIDVEDLAKMAADKSTAERCSAAKKVLEAVRDSADLPDQREAVSIPKPLFSKELKAGCVAQITE